MHQPLTNPHPGRQLAEPARNAWTLIWFCALSFALLLRFTVSPQLLNLVMSYTTESGALYEKLHLGTYAIFILTPLALARGRFLLIGDEIGKFKAISLYSVFMLLLVPYLFLVGRAGSSGFVIDTYLVAGAAGLAVLSFDRTTRRKFGDVILMMLIVSAALGLLEALTHHRFLPYALNELQFRPIGLSAHPLALGALCALALGFVALTGWPMIAKLLAMLILFLGCAASGARTALLLTVVEIVLLLLFSRWSHLSRHQERQAKILALVVAAAIGAVLVSGLSSAGLLNRFNGTLFDENFMARITIYRVFSYTSWEQILFGMGPTELLAIVNRKLHLPYIESAPVVIGLLFGLPLAIAFTLMILWLPIRLMRKAAPPAKIATGIFLLAALSNNTLSSKTPEMTMIIVLILAYAQKSSPDDRVREPQTTG